MQLKLLIQKLQALYESYDADYFKVMGEPEILIDLFDRAGELKYTYGGIGGVTDIVVEDSSDGVYKIISAFAKDYENQYTQIKAQKRARTLSDEATRWPF